MTLPVVAIDTGFGNTKFLYPEPGGSEVRIGVFRSVAESVAIRPRVFTGVAQRDTFYVKIGSALFQVGHDILGSANTSLVLNPDYPESAQYLALTIGALAYILEHTGETEIDRLVLGLPVSTFSKHREMVRARFQGLHKVPTRGDILVDMLIKEVKVIPQPAGSYLSWRRASKQSGAESGAATSKVVLILDQGEYTFDWMVIADEKVVYERSGAIHAGMSEIHKHVLAQFQQDLNVHNIGLEMMRVGLMEGKLDFRGQVIDFAKYVESAKAKASTIVDQMLELSGNMNDISAVVLAGGGAAFFHDALRAKLGVTGINVPHEPLFSNVYGFYLSGL